MSLISQLSLIYFHEFSLNNFTGLENVAIMDYSERSSLKIILYQKKCQKDNTTQPSNYYIKNSMKRQKTCNQALIDNSIHQISGHSNYISKYLGTALYMVPEIILKLMLKRKIITNRKLFPFFDTKNNIFQSIS